MKGLVITVSLLAIGLAIFHPILPPILAESGQQAIQAIPQVNNQSQGIDAHLVTVILSTLIPVTLYLLKERFPGAFSGQANTSKIKDEATAQIANDVEDIVHRVRALEDHVYGPPQIYKPPSPSLNGDSHPKPPSSPA